jgi:hypoxanthine phosphoribosyltransferase
MEKVNYRVLISEEQLKERIRQLGDQITEDYKGKDIHCICVLKGGVLFMTDLTRHIQTDRLTMDFMGLSSYENARESTGIVKITKDLDEAIEGKDVLIVEDILDSGRSLKYLTEVLTMRKPKSIKICTLLDKPSRRKVDIKPDYVGFTIENLFVLGYGLDYDQYLRNLPYVAVVDGE